MATSRVCSIPECGKPARYRKHGSLCWTHYRHYLQARPPSDTPKFDGWAWLSALSGTTETECILWPRGTGADGYGSFSHRGKRVRANRVSCELRHGPSPGLLACHSCDNPLCVNPNHLYWGTHAQNAADATARNRRPVGSAMASAKLTEDKAREIFVSPLSPKALAEMYGVHDETVRRIKKRTAWAHATAEVASPSSPPTTEQSRPPS